MSAGRTSGLKDLYRKNFLEYASYVIKERAIPDEADGLKPVQRRILWTMREMDDGRFSKVANVIGHCMRYHPHGDQSIGAALVALANRGYFIERQGNFGNVLTGDEASAPRYIECRLTELARETLFNKRITDFVPSYDGRNEEPVVLPAKLPTLLLLGAEGIAVGMSTRIFPHNFREVLMAQVACLRGEGFRLLPDFPQGGLMDASDYEDGRGRIRCRARIEAKGKNLVIRELPWGTTTESLIASIEAAARKGRIKIASIDDFTTDTVEINVRLGRGVDTDEGLQRLYAHTDCETTHTSNLVIIEEGSPVEATVSDVMSYCCGRLIEILKLELKLEMGDLEDRLHRLTLERIFIENRLYRHIEEEETLDGVRSAVLDGLRPYTEEEGLQVTEEDVERLLKLHIRRISRYDIEANLSEVGQIRARMKEVRSHLRRIVEYAVAWVEDILERYGAEHHRRTTVESFTEIDVKEISIRNMKAGFDPETGLLGTSVKGPRTFTVSEYDRFVVFLADGTFRVVPMQEKYFVDGRCLHCGLLDQEQVFTAVYRRGEDGISYIKRFRIESFILDKSYEYVPRGSEVLLLTGEPEMKLDYWFVRTKGMRRRKGDCLVSSVRVTNYSAKGVQLCGRKVVSSLKATPVDDEEPEGEGEEEEDEEAVGPDAGGEPQGEAPGGDGGAEAPDADARDEGGDDDGGEGGEGEALTPDEVIERAESLRRRSSEVVRQAESPEGDDDDLFSGVTD